MNQYKEATSNGQQFVMIITLDKEILHIAKSKIEREKHLLFTNEICDAD